MKSIIKKKSILVELFFKKPCQNCLVKACCLIPCENLTTWENNNKMLIGINDITVLLLEILLLINLEILIRLKIINKQKYTSHLEKIRKLERSIYFISDYS